MEATRMMELIHTADSVTHLLAALRAEGANKVQLSSAMKSYLSLKAREKAVPISGQFELTPLCNLDCKMCYVHLNRDQMQGQPLLPAETWENLMQQAIDQGMMYATLTGGECLTYPDFDRLYLFLHNAGVQVTVFTNGVLLNEKRIRFFQAYPPEYLQVTLYGSCNDAYEKVTGHRLFDTVMHNIRMADEAGLPIKIAITPNRFSLEDHEALLKTVVEAGLPFGINSELMSPREETGRADEQVGISFAEYVRLIKLQQKLLGGIMPQECVTELPEPQREGKSSPIGLRCAAGNSAFAMDWRGQMSPCTSMSDVAEDTITLGFEQSWKRIHEFAANYPLPMECEECVYKKIAPHCPVPHRQSAMPGHVSRQRCNYCRDLVASGIQKLD